MSYGRMKTEKNGWKKKSKSCLKKQTTLTEKKTNSMTKIAVAMKFLKNWPPGNQAKENQRSKSCFRSRSQVSPGRRRKEKGRR